MTGRPIGVALAAFGSAARVFHIPLLRATPGLELRTIVSRRPDQVRAALPEVMAVRDFAAACADPAIDLVVIPTPNDTHAPLAAQALRPASTSWSTSRSPSPWPRPIGLALAAAKGRVLSVFQNRRWDADFLALRQVLGSGAVGEPVLLESTSTASAPRSPTAGAIARARARASGTISARIWSTRRSSCSARRAPSSSTSPPSATAPPRRPLPRPTALRPPARHPARHHARRRRTPRFALHGTRGSWVKYGTDPQEAALKAGARPGGPGWGTTPAPAPSPPRSAASHCPARPATTAPTTAPSATPSAAPARPPSPRPRPWPS